MVAATRIISIVGPESTGKSTLAKQLGKHFSAPVVPEFARAYLAERNGKYVESDLVEIAQGQANLERELLAENSKILICDTDLTVLKVWQEFKFKRPSTEIDSLLANQVPRVHLLTYPDLPWKADLLRESQGQVMELFHIYERLLTDLRSDYHIVKGTGEERLRVALNHVLPVIQNGTT